ncbi:molecular chaperone DnaJ [Zoogloea sp. LCSB751]|uniref:molecular chaperone DnaJ n=1 Tax=Zoogloea sp. LCSB751 TaxID=1965277 RepID=UPI0009A5191F|nr:molecular chaperone DnaJ [Zoogloea sp. LCSB751]
MHDAYSTTGDDEWVIWNGEHGLVTTATLGRVEVNTTGRKAWLDEPFDMVGPFSLDELETHGRIAFAACIVMSRQRWQDDQAALRYASLNMRRAAQQRMNEEFARFSGRHGRNHGQRHPVDEREHRAVLNLPAEGTLEPSQVNAAFRKLAQKAHPDVGGSHEQFVRITKARSVLLESINR